MTAFHPLPMLSIDAIFSASEFPAWTNETCLVEAKLDGVALELVYEHGVLTEALLRGDGHRGEVVTEQASQVSGVRLTLPAGAPGYLVVRGEVVMLRAATPAWKTGRHLAAARLRSASASKDGLLFVAHGAPTLDEETEAGAMLQLDFYGFTVAPRILNGAGSDLARAVQTMRSRTLPYDSDGVVVKINDRDRQVQLGTGPRAPRWAVACKWGS